MRKILIFFIILFFFSFNTCEAVYDEQTTTILNEPTVVKVIVEYKAYFSYPYPKFTFVNNEFVFDKQVEIYEENISNLWSGTGFVISPDGYVITNAHIADPEHYKLIGYLYDHALEISDFFQSEGFIDPFHYNLFLSSYYDYLVDNGDFKAEQLEINIEIGNITLPAELIISGDPIGFRTSKDVAIIKIESEKEYPFSTVKLGDSDKVEVGNEIIALGYFMELNKSKLSSNLISATGKILDFKEFGDWEALQTDADITFGFSGGPVFNLDNEVIGISAFGIFSPISQTETKFLVPINVAKEFLSRTNINNERSEIDEHYQKGIEYFFDEEYYAAINELAEVLELNPEHFHARNYIKQAEINTYPDRFKVEVNANRLPSYLSTQIILDEYLNVTIFGNKQYAFNLPNEQKPYNISVDRYIDGGDGMRFHCENYIRSFQGLSRGEKLTFVYDPQYYLKITSEFGEPQGEGWYDSNVTVSTVMLGVSNHPGDYEISLNNTRADFKGWSGDASGSSEKSDNILMDKPKNVLVEWKKEYTLEIISDYGEIKPYIGKEWYRATSNSNESTFVNVKVDKPVYFDFNNFQYFIFVEWKGDASGSSPEISIKMDGPKRVHAIWKTEDFFTHNKYILITAIIGTIILIFLIMHKFTKRAKREI
ncbi:S1C family serine protease [[Eubacterium] cellulosolvens]